MLFSFVLPSYPCHVDGIDHEVRGGGASSREFQDPVDFNTWIGLIFLTASKIKDRCRDKALPADAKTQISPFSRIQHGRTRQWGENGSMNSLAQEKNRY
jgi:hypothetical protein